MVDLQAELGFRRRGHRLARDVSPYWSVHGHLFGGYSAALALAAVPAAGRHPWALSVACQFHRPATDGPVEVEVECLREGRTTSAYRSTLLQDDHRVLTLSGWFARPPESEPVAILTTAPPPDACPRAWWRERKNVFDASFERRAVDYPAHRQDFGERPEAAELWVRPVPPLAATAPAWLVQAVDLMCFDAHIVEPAVEWPDVSRAGSYSFDLLAWWEPVACPPGWRRLHVGTHRHPRVASCTASLWSEDVPLVAGAAQQARLAPADAPYADAASNQ